MVLIQSKVLLKVNLKICQMLKYQMSSMDSSALCKVKVNGENVTMDYQNKEKFSISPIIFESTVIKKDGKDIFLLSNYSTTDQFSCIISTASEEARAPTSTSTPTSTQTPTPVSTTTSGEDEAKSGRYNRYYLNNGSKGLTGGAIAGIIIACLAAVAIVAALVVLIKKGVFASKNAGLANSVNQSSISSVNMNLKFENNNI